MAENDAPQMQATLGLTGLTMNAMALIAPGAFLWLTFLTQVNGRGDSALDVDRHPLCRIAVPGNRGLLRGNGKALPRYW